ncbi:MAG: lipopolysaccharide biosynthesis protein [Hyphomonas sp.]|uniref:oligosaccharide flippase family protein n=1 Tax=Hyphomonas sp. TaxID=87 RepID=UPI0035299E4A
MKLARHLAGYLPVNLANAIAAFGGVYVFTRLLSAEAYGVYALMFWVMAMIHTVCLTWVEAAGYRFSGAAEANGQLADHYRTALPLMVMATSASLIVCAVLWVIFRDRPAYAATIPWIAALLPINSVVQVALEAHKAGQRVRRYVFTETFRLLMGFALGAFAAWKLGLGSAAPFFGMVVAGGLMALREIVWLMQSSAGGKTSAARQKAWAAYGLPIAAALVLDLIVSGADRPMIAAMLPDGEAQVGAYAAGYGAAQRPVTLICTWAAMAGSPLLMAAYEKEGPEETRNAARQLATFLLFAGIPATVGIALVARPFAEAMIGEDVREGALKIIPWIAVTGLLNGLLISYFSEAFQLAHKTAERAFLMAVPAVANIALNYFLLPVMGLMGAVVATVASYVIAILLLAVIGRKYVALPVPWTELAKILAAALAMWPAVMLVPALGGWPELILKAGIGAAVYVIAAFALDAAGVRQLIRQRL